MKKIVLYGGIVLAVILLILLITWWNSPLYHQDWIIGKTQEQVVARFGEFDFYYEHTDFHEGISLCYRGGYRITADYVDGLGTWQGKRLYICFDENGIAYLCRESQEGYVS